MRRGEVIGALWKMFRESAKTTLAKIGVIHAICYKKSHFIIWSSFDQKKAEANLFDVVIQLQTNKKLIKDFGQLFYGSDSGKKSEKKSIKEFITANDIKVKAYSTGQSIRGEVYSAYRPDFIILDDIETLKTVVSEARTRQVIDFIDELLSGMAGYCNVLVLANSLSFTGSVAYLEEKIKKLKGWIVRDVPVVTDDDELVWPEKYTLTDKEAEEYNLTVVNKEEKKVSLETKRRLLSEIVFNREMLNKPLTEDEREFKLKWMQKTYTDKDLDGKVLNTYVILDIADSKDKKKQDQKGDPDYTGIVVVAIDTYNNWYILYAKRERLNAPEKIEKIFWLWQTFKPIKIGIEKKAFEDEMKPYIRIKSEETKIYPVVEELKHGGIQKEQRIRGALQGRFQHGKIFFANQPIDDTDKLKIEAYDFPKAKHDDLLDALAYTEQLGIAPYALKNEMGYEMTDIEQEFWNNKQASKTNFMSRLRKL